MGGLSLYNVGFISGKTTGRNPLINPIWDLNLQIANSVEPSTASWHWYPSITQKDVECADKDWLTLHEYEVETEKHVPAAREEFIRNFNQIVEDMYLVGFGASWLDSLLRHESWKHEITPTWKVSMDLETLIVGFLRGCGDATFASPLELTTLLELIGEDANEFSQLRKTKEINTYGIKIFKKIMNW